MAAKKPRSTRNKELIRGVGRFSRSKIYHKRGLWALKEHNGGSFPQHVKPTAEPAVDAKKKSPKFYPAEDVPKPLINKRKHKCTKLRASITPGTILIILTGHFKGKRVVFLKQLESGLLLVTGPFKVNGVPTRRVNQVYVIATSTKIDVSNVDVSKYDDKYFEREKVKKEKTEEQFFEAEKKPEKYVAPHRKEDQKVLDEQVLKAAEAIPDLRHYLSARFSLRSGMKPHELVF
ncbi:large ribosomal subunit protein eL6 [Cryptomeria japonica]|uniref:large ribosomal subunit protein eL6 n=1 Tax=Cryptomeria japonica TaxID=3369 RepID=UPI0027DA05B1|nr:large ribosomal subunit protein eL6 [Cryptomeria japonica]